MFKTATDSSGGVCWCCGICSSVIYMGLLRVVGLEASDEERMAGGQSLHQTVEGLTELTAQCRHLFGVSRGLQGWQRDEAKS